MAQAARGQAEGNHGQSQSRQAKGKAPACTVAPADKDDGPQPEISPASNTTKKLAVHWEGAHSTCTSQLIAWCRANNDAYIKLFSDSVKDAKEIKRKYNEFNKFLKQTGARLTYNKLQKNPQIKTLIDSQLNKFPWWPDLHSWWRTNPTYNTIFLTADYGQNYESATLQHFCMPDHEDAQLPADENKSQEDVNIEDGEIIDTGDVDSNVDTCQEDVNPIDATNARAAGQVDDDIVMEQSDQFFHAQQAPMSSHSSSSAPSFFVGLPLQAHMLPCHIFTHPSL
ncbi:hypothetical protein F4604DRAFT_1928015 [Suillus subluteus]|nr:hypothetical protein F4604DRAFT_1928015 [Suillus subluteus]